MMVHVLWIGGPPGSGKTSVARRLARTYGLRLYSTDNWTWVHRDRALAAGLEPARRWEAMTPTEREQAAPEDMLQMSLHAERGPMVLADLSALPASPLVVAEGTSLPASAVSAGVIAPSHAVWLLPTPELLEARLAERTTAPGVAALYRLLADVIATEAADHGLPTLAVDGSRSLEDTADEVAQRWAGALAAGPRADNAVQRRELLREINRAVAGQVRGYFARPWAVGDPAAARQSFVCECGAADCLVEVSATVGGAEAGPLRAAGHGGGDGAGEPRR